MSVHVIATGGTISSHHDGTDWTNLTGAELIGELGPLAADVVVTDVAAGPSSNLSVDDMAAIARRVRDALAHGADGVVVVHGTDTMELTAFATQLLLGTDAERAPVVFTGSMRVHSHPSPDGPANLRDSVAVAAHPAARGRDVMVCLNGELHAAARVVKRSAASVDAFTSAPFGPIGTVADGAVEFAAGSDGAVHAAAAGLAGDVALVTAYPGMTADELRLHLHGRPGAVVEVFGDLNSPHQLWGPLHEAGSTGALVVLASRPFTPTADGDGLRLLGVTGAGGLTAQKARLAVMAALATATDREERLAFVHQYALRYDAGDRSTS